MQFLMKTSVNQDQIHVKDTLFPRHAFEVHLGKEIEKVTDLYSLTAKTELGNLILQTYGDVPIKVVHMPIMKNNNYFIEGVDAKKVLSYVLKTAEYVRTMQGQFEKIIVVVHTKLTTDVMQQYGLLDSTIEILVDNSIQYPNVEIALENTIYDFSSANMNYFTNLDLAKLCQRKNIGTCVDICHLKVSQYMDTIMRKKYEHLSTVSAPKFDECFEQHKDYLKLIHFANASDSEKGYGRGLGHGSGFGKKDTKEVNEILSVYQKYGLTCPLTLEIIEKDYLHPYNCIETMEVLRHLHYQD